MMMKLSLTRGRTRWVDQNEARMLQREGQVICVLAMRNEEPAEFSLVYGLNNDYPGSSASLAE